MTATASAEPERSRVDSGITSRARPGALPSTTPASPTPVPRPWQANMPRWVRIVLSAFGFGLFFGSSFLIGLIVAPVMLLWPGSGDRLAFTRKLNSQLWRFLALMRDLGMIAYWPPQLPKGFEDRPFLLIANHPSLLDVVFTLAAIPQLSCVAKGTWYRSKLMGTLLRRTAYIPGSGYHEDADVMEDVPVIRRIEKSLRDGVPVLVFPEGTRSKERSLQRFTRGAIEAAIRAEVPILPLFIGVTPAYLMKGQPFYHVPKTTPIYTFEWLPAVETEGRGLDSKSITRELQTAYQARFTQQVEERDALDAPL